MYSYEDKKHILKHVDEFGIQSAIHAFGVKKSSIYSWKKKVIQNYQDTRVLINKSTKPKKVRTRVGNWDYRIQNFIQEIRFKYIGIGHEKVYVLLQKQALKESWNCNLPSKQTVARIISDLKKDNLIPNFKPNLSFYANNSTFRIKLEKRKKKKRPENRKFKRVGDRIQIDTVVLILTGGIRRYVIQAVDVYSRLTFSYAYKSLSSNSSKDFLIKMRSVYPFIDKNTEIQNDNGSEFMKYFESYLKEEGITQVWNYKKSPKMNAYIERFNRTSQEEFIYKNSYLLRDNIDQFNKKLMHWLVWYNTQRPHHSLDLKSPIDFILSQDRFSKMWWVGTKS